MVKDTQLIDNLHFWVVMNNLRASIQIHQLDIRNYVCPDDFQMMPLQRTDTGM